MPPADFLLEAEKRGSPPKSEKRQLLARRGSGVGGGAALLREEKGEYNGNENAESTQESQSGLQETSHSLVLQCRFCESTRNDDSFRDSSPTAQNDKILQFRRIYPFYSKHLPLAH